MQTTFWRGPRGYDPLLDSTPELARTMAVEGQPQ
jgi:hypothetical protein